MPDLSSLVDSFKCLEILNSDTQLKSVALLGEIKSQKAILILEKSPFAIDGEDEKITDSIEQLQLINHNDVYYWSNVILKSSLPKQPSGKVNLVYPATDTHIKKYRQQRHHYVLETPQMYQFAIEYINSMKGDRIKWVYNILFEGKESESFVHHEEDPEMGYVLLPDMKWDKVSMENLYLCCIVKRKDISTIRDLNSSHLGFLKMLSRDLKKYTSNNFDIQADELRIFAHYHPSYYHFHLHIVNVRHPGLGNGIAVGKAILLDDIIENISIKSDYYARRNIGYILGENHDLWKTDKYRNAHYEVLNSSY